MYPRGIRNANPGNIERGIRWEGLAEEQTDERFCVFVSPLWGIRAMAMILKNYQKRHGLRTVAQMIERWAPSAENDSRAYANHVASDIGVRVHEQLDLTPENLYSMVYAMIKHENGMQPYCPGVIVCGIELATGNAAEMGHYFD